MSCGLAVDALRPKAEIFANALDQLGQLDIPTVASVQGGCTGGGFELALACDPIIASRSARFFSGLIVPLHQSRA
jgi:enoyl-CoA hydratase/carnithine racemase